MRPKGIISKAALVPAYRDKLQRVLDELDAELWVLDLDAEAPTFSLQVNGDEWRLLTKHKLPGVLQIGGSPDEVRARLQAHGWIELDGRNDAKPIIEGAHRRFESVSALTSALEKVGLETPTVEADADGRHFTVQSSDKRALLAGVVPDAGTSQLIVLDGGVMTTKTLFPSTLQNATPG